MAVYGAVSIIFICFWLIERGGGGGGRWMSLLACVITLLDCEVILDLGGGPMLLDFSSPAFSGVRSLP